MFGKETSLTSKKVQGIEAFILEICSVQDGVSDFFKFVLLER